MNGETCSKNRFKQYSISSVFHALMCLFVRILIYCAAHFGNFPPPPPGRVGARCISRDHAQGMKIMFSLWPRKQGKSTERHLRAKQLLSQVRTRKSVYTAIECLCSWREGNEATGIEKLPPPTYICIGEENRPPRKISAFPYPRPYGNPLGTGDFE